MAANFSGSLTQDSDEIKEMYCEECDRHGDGYATAVAFCDIKDTEKLLNAKSEVIKNQEEHATDTCKEHSNKLIATYKQQHKDLIDDFDKKMEETIARLKKERLELIQKLSEKERNFEKKITSDQIQNSYIQRYKLKESDIQPTSQSLEDQTRFFSFNEVHVSAVEKKIAFNCDINHEFDRITSLLVLSEHTLLASNYNRCSLVIFSLEKSNEEYIKATKFNTNPWEITKVSDNKIAVTFPDEVMIRLITFSEEMKVIDIDVIPGNGCCYGITYSNKHLVVSYYKLFKASSIKILSMSGKIVKSFDKDDYGQNLFSCPWYLTVSPDNSMIYVTDCGRQTVTCLTFDGKMKAIYKDDRLKDPYQLAVDEYGSVYVCSRDSKNIHQLSHDLTKVKILLNKRNISPTSIAYCQNTKRLFVGINNDR
ncbi:uncharacterized protein LOC132743775 [Ruditapes philippinarum]|uniref:uncharacterized protein LOC132743775 n=1 Tax=Ruditapes philippinarum TaxID=129788 RepID=UPI00295C1C64|nr:uncharacterized protein LOC132743775 [Ruditapes philippinarum]